MNDLKRKIFLAACKLSGSDAEDHEESEFESQFADSMVALFDSTMQQVLKESFEWYTDSVLSTDLNYAEQKYAAKVRANLAKLLPTVTTKEQP